MFSDDAAQRHFPICERNSHSSKLMVVRDNSKNKKGQIMPTLNRKLSKKSIATNDKSNAV